MSGDLSVLLSMRDSLTNPDHLNILNSIDGTYNEDFKLRVRSGSIPLKCYSLMKMKSSGLSKNPGFQPCLILNDGYNVLKFESTKPEAE